MAFQSPSSVIDHTSDAGYRTWTLEHRNLMLTGNSLVQTSDTNQLDFATATRPGINTDGLPVIFRLNDDLQATSPYFIALYYGTGSSVERPRIRVSIGTGSTGTGALTGTIVTLAQVTNSSAPASSVTLYESVACGLAGSIFVGFKLGAVSTLALSILGIHRVRDLAGNQTGEGLIMYGLTAGSALECRSMRSVSPTLYGPSSMVCLLVMGTTSSVVVGGARQAYAHATAIPDVRPVPEYLTVVASEFAVGLPFQARPPGTLVDRTYLCLGTRIGAPGAGTGSSTHALCPLWE